MRSKTAVKIIHLFLESDENNELTSMISKVNKFHNLFEKMNVITKEHLIKATQDNFSRLKTHLDYSLSTKSISKLIAEVNPSLEIDSNIFHAKKNLKAKNSNLKKVMESLMKNQISSIMLIPKL